MRVNDLFFWLMGVLMVGYGVKQANDPYTSQKKRYPATEIPMETVELTRKIGIGMTVLGILFLVIAVIRLFR